jgi:rSAM/selenodomain-associated transferase 1
MERHGRRMLAIVCRNPEVGMVKTRLIPALGVEGARSLYRAFLQDLGCRFAGREYDLLWSYTPEGGPPDPSLTPGRTRAQEGPDLGHRLFGIFEQAAGDGYEYIVVVSSDVPHLPEYVVGEAFEALHSADVVLAPSEDGGYHLVGMSRPRDIFTMVPMSTPDVFEQTRVAIAEHRISAQILATDFDVDTPEDLPRLAGRLAQDASMREGGTARVLRELGGVHVGARTQDKPVMGQLEI